MRCVLNGHYSCGLQSQAIPGNTARRRDVDGLPAGNRQRRPAAEHCAAMISASPRSASDSRPVTTTLIDSCLYPLDQRTPPHSPPICLHYQKRTKAPPVYHLISFQPTHLYPIFAQTKRSPCSTTPRPSLYSAASRRYPCSTYPAMYPRLYPALVDGRAEWCPWHCVCNRC